MLGQPDDLDTDEDVDLTNLIDPMVLLSALMMILLPTLQAAQLRVTDVKIPDADGRQPAAADLETTRLLFTQDGVVKLNDEIVATNELETRLRDLPAETSVLIVGDTDASFGKGFELINLVQEAGLNCLGLTETERGE